MIALNAMKMTPKAGIKSPGSNLSKPECGNAIGPHNFYQRSREEAPAAEDDAAVAAAAVVWGLDYIQEEGGAGYPAVEVAKVSGWTNERWEKRGKNIGKMAFFIEMSGQKSVL